MGRSGTHETEPVAIGGVMVAVVLAVCIGAWSLARAGEVGVRSVGFVPYWDQERAVEEANRYADHLSVVAPWWYAVRADGRIVEQHAEFTDVDMELVRRLQRQGRAVMPAIANHHAGSWDFEVVGRLLDDPAAVERHVQALTELVVDNGYDGLQLDYENLRAADAAAYGALVRRVAKAFDEHGKTVAVAVHAKVESRGRDWSVGHDYELLGRHADELHVMAYDYHYDASEPGPPAPAWWVEDVVEYATSVVPAEKIILGIGLYGYDWGPGERAEGLTLQEAEARIHRYQGDLTFDRRSQSPVFRYQLNGDDHELWFEDARSVERKLELVAEHELGGAFFWRLGGTTPEVWEAVGTLDTTSP